MIKLTKVVAILLLISACDQAPVLSPKQTDQLDTVKVTENLRIKLDIKSEQIKGLKDLKADFILENISGNPLSYEFSSGCQFGYTIKRNGELIFDSRNNQACTMALTKLTLDPGQSKTYSISLESYDIDNDLENGTYTVRVFLLDNHDVEISTSFNVN